LIDLHHELKGNEGNKGKKLNKVLDAIPENSIDLVEESLLRQSETSNSTVNKLRVS